MLNKRKKYLVNCPKNKQFKNVIVCAAVCEDHRTCRIYKNAINMRILEAYVEKHPEYEIIGEIMVVKKTEKSVKQKRFWIIKPDKTVTEVTEKEIISNPQKYLGKEIWDKPPFKYEVVISLKKVKA